MRRIVAASLLVLVALLPAIGTVYCLDGCTDTNHAAYGWQLDVASSHAECGVCLNAVAVHCTIARLDPPSEPVAMAPLSSTTFFSIPLRSVDRPPRA